ncbi:F0F1 ATP synthase subunit delta [Rhodocyclus tenuis]|uniref:ATP synthase subunit delta n=2 Tax=Rhodocyclus TaxID=1064 RepID=A0A6L5K0Q8_RHOTE|nr:F0F1 ATP synthase subunit delta [Rhodocyclus gracilis]MQY52430.1 F0F1 ATP synthase subunit delta [Rhodocyclus gracilis]MRD73566.1 F0F1 ATP synthase subunit delta [Rhodocyclus gracilis]NJA88324.1 F0F1 ATP synthase subunit delta [Rhodocyclus gracilis]
MAELVTIARPYAEAVFRLALEKKALDAWSEQLSLLAAISVDEHVRSRLNDPELTAAQKAELVLALLGNEVGSDESSLVRVLADNGRLALLPEIASLFAALKGAEEGVKDAVIHSAFPLDDAQLATLLGDLEKRFGSRLKAEVVVDQSLVGGVKIVVGDQVLDASVRGKLEALGAALKN